MVSYIGTGEYEKNSNVRIEGTPKDTNNYYGWYKRNAPSLYSKITNEDQFVSTVVGNAIYEPGKKYNITYNLDGGTLNGATGTYADTYLNTELKQLSMSATKSGYTLDGWMPSGETAVVRTQSAGTTGDKTYTAKWLQNYNVTINTGAYKGPSSHSTLPDSSSNQIVAEGRKVTNPGALTTSEKGWYFAGWSVNYRYGNPNSRYLDDPQYELDDLYDFNSPVTGRVVLYPRWIECLDLYWTGNIGGNGSYLGAGDWTAYSNLSAEYINRYNKYTKVTGDESKATALPWAESKRMIYIRPNGTVDYANPYYSGRITVKRDSDLMIEMVADSTPGKQTRIEIGAGPTSWLNRGTLLVAATGSFPYGGTEKRLTGSTTDSDMGYAYYWGVNIN